MQDLYNPWFPPRALSPAVYSALIALSSSLQELKLPVYRAHSPQIGMRRYFADLLAILSNRYQLCPTARHLAVYLLDLFMDHYDVAVKQLYVIALSCLLLASKCSPPACRRRKLTIEGLTVQNVISKSQIEGRV